MMVLRTRSARPDESPVPGVIPAPTQVVHEEPPADDQRGARRRTKAARLPLIPRVRAVWPRRRTDRP
jgi:hypothetical protein